MEALENLLRRKVESETWKDLAPKPKIWRYTAEAGRSEVLQAELKIRDGELNGKVLSALVSSELDSLEKEIRASDEFKKLDGNKVFIKRVTPEGNGFTASFQVHRRK